MKRKFDIAYFIAKEGLPFTKMTPLCQLEERHDVNLGTRYKPVPSLLNSSLRLSSKTSFRFFLRLIFQPSSWWLHRLCHHWRELPRKGGIRPLRACRIWFVSHKVSALGKSIKYGVYLSHLTMLTEDPDVKSVDKQRITGYILRWHEPNMLLEVLSFTIYLNQLLLYARHYKKMKCVCCMCWRSSD